MAMLYMEYVTLFHVNIIAHNVYNYVVMVCVLVVKPIVLDSKMQCLCAIYHSRDYVFV